MTRTPTALIEIDFQGWIVDLGHDPGVVSRARAVRERLVGEGALLICSRYASPDPVDAVRSLGSPDAAFVPSMEPPVGAIVLSKSDRNIFDNPDVHANLRAGGIRRVEFSGIATDYGVSAAAETALELGYDVAVHAEACAGTSRAAHRASLARLAALGVIVE